MTMPPRYKSQTRAKLMLAGKPDGMADSVREFLTKMNESYERITSDPHLSPAGQKARMTQEAKLALFNARDRRKAIRSKLRELNAKGEKLMADRKPLAPTESETAMVLRILDRIERLEDKGQREQASSLWKNLSETDPDPQTYRLQIAFSQLPKAVVGAMGEQVQMLIGMQQQIKSLTPELQDLATQAETLEDEDKQLAEACAVVIPDCDRSELEKAGIVQRYPTSWTSDERQKYLETHTYDEYQQLLADEMREKTLLSRGNSLGFIEDESEATDDITESGAPQAA